MKRFLWFMVLGVGMAWATPPEVEQGGDEVVLKAEDGVESGLLEIPEAQRKAYFESKPDGLLVDPQRLLSPVVRKDRLAFLQYHAGDSSIDLQVYLLAGDQRIPDGRQCEEVLERFFAVGKPTAVVWYPFGAPERAALFLSEGLKEGVPDAENKRALASSVMQAAEKSDPAGQLEAFLVQMSIRLYWMERMIAGEGAEEGKPVEVPVVRDDRAEEGEGSTGGPLQAVIAVACEWAMEAGVVIALTLMLAVVVVSRRLRARLVLPDFSVEPRLGGEHGAGVGAVISFASASVPPASQRGESGVGAAIR